MEGSEAENEILVYDRLDKLIEKWILMVELNAVSLANNRKSQDGYSSGPSMSNG